MSDRASNDEHGRTIGRAAQETSDRAESLSGEIDEAAALICEIFARPGAERQELIQELRFHDLKVCQVLVERSGELWWDDAGAAVEVARLAVEISRRLDVRWYGRGLVEDMRALAWARLGNSYRVASDLRSAEEALDQAEAHLERSGGEAYTEAEILSFRASLRTSQGRFHEATRLLDGALAIYRAAKDRHLEGKTLIKKGLALGYDGQFERAIRFLRQGLLRIETTEDSRLLVSAHHNLAGFLNDSGEHEQALDTLRQARHLYDHLGEPSHRARLSWLEGRITRDLGRLDEAEAALKEARDFFVEHEIGLDAALVLLDLATVYAQRGDTAELKRLSAEMVPIFASRGVHPEALAALALFQKAAEAEQVDRALLDQIAAELQQTPAARRDVSS